MSPTVTLPPVWVKVAVPPEPQPAARAAGGPAAKAVRRCFDRRCGQRAALDVETDVAALTAARGIARNRRRSFDIDCGEAVGRGIEITEADRAGARGFGNELDEDRAAAADGVIGAGVIAPPDMPLMASVAPTPMLIAPPLAMNWTVPPVAELPAALTR